MRDVYYCTTIRCSTQPFFCNVFFYFFHAHLFFSVWTIHFKTETVLFLIIWQAERENSLITYLHNLNSYFVALINFFFLVEISKNPILWNFYNDTLWTNWILIFISSLLNGTENIFRFFFILKHLMLRKITFIMYSCRTSIKVVYGCAVSK